MHGFGELFDVADRLNEPDGCPWDLEQTFESLRPYILEEAHEVLEAIDNDDDDHIIEELGDLFYTVIFYAKVAERENRFAMKHIIERLRIKLIRRHPHVIGEEKASSMEDVIRQWEKVKKEEGKDKKRESVLDGIPPTLPSLQRAQKIAARIKKHGVALSEQKPQTEEEEFARQILEIVDRANEANVDLECALRKVLSSEEKAFRKVEK